MASLINKMVSWAAKEAEELASKSGMSIERAAEEVADKYGQKAFAATTATSKSTALVPVGEVVPRTAGEIRGPARLEREVEEKVRPGATRDPYAEMQPSLSESLRQTESVAPKEQPLALPPGRKFPSKSDTSASEDFEASLGNLDTGIYPEINIPKGAKAAAGVGAVGAGLAMTGDTSRSPQYSDLPPEVDKEEVNASIRSALQQPVAELEKKSTPELKKTISQSLKEADKKADNPPAGTPPEQVDKFKEQRDKAYEMYDQAKSRNEWLELAQVLGQAFTQFGAAQSGMRTGRSMAGLSIPSVDYGARTGQEQRLLESRLRDIGEAETRQQRLTEREQERADTAKYRQQELALKKSEFAEKAAERAGRMTTEERQDKQLKAKSLQSELANKQQELKASQEFANQLSMEDDLSSKTLKKIEEKTPGILAKAGIDPIDLKQIEQEATQRGYIWDSLDKDKKSQLIQERIVDKKKQEITNLKGAIDSLWGSRQQAAPSATMTQAAPAAAQRQDPQIANYARQYNLDYGHAKDILVKRGYTPKE